MQNHAQYIDQQALHDLEDRLRRGIPKWEHADFIELVVPLLVKKLQDYMTDLDKQGATR